MLRHLYVESPRSYALLEEGSKFWDREANVPVRAVDHVKVPEPLVLRKPLDNWVAGNVYVWLFRVTAPEMEAVPTTSSLVSGVESPIPRLLLFRINRLP